MSVAHAVLALIALNSAWSWPRIAASAAIAAISTFWMVQECQILASALAFAFGSGGPPALVLLGKIPGAVPDRLFYY